MKNAWMHSFVEAKKIRWFQTSLKPTYFLGLDETLLLSYLLREWQRKVECTSLSWFAL
jgi:hypothetical protein